MDIKQIKYRDIYKNRNTWMDIVDEYRKADKPIKCEICGIKSKRGVVLSMYGKFTLDHNHQSKFIRGVLCKSCNKGLGNFKDNPKILKKARQYIIKDMEYNKTRETEHQQSPVI